MPSAQLRVYGSANRISNGIDLDLEYILGQILTKNRTLVQQKQEPVRCFWRYLMRCNQAEIV